MSDQEPQTEDSVQTKFAKLMAKFLQENGFPPSILNSRSFEVLMETIAQCGPDCEFPSQEELSGPLTGDVMNWVAERRKKHERAWEWHGCTLMMDSWTHPGRRLHLLTFMVGSVEGIFFLGSADASYATNHADLLAELIAERIDEVGRDKVVQVVTDNSHNLKAACKILMDRIPTLFWTPYTVLDPLCFPVLGPYVEGHWEAARVQEAYSTGQACDHIYLQAWKISQCIV